MQFTLGLLKHEEDMMYIISGRKMIEEHWACSRSVDHICKKLGIQRSQGFTFKEACKLLSSTDGPTYSFVRPLDWMLWYTIRKVGDKEWEEIRKDWKEMAKKYTKQIRWTAYVGDNSYVPEERLRSARIYTYTVKQAKLEARDGH